MSEAKSLAERRKTITTIRGRLMLLTLGLVLSGLLAGAFLLWDSYRNTRAAFDRQLLETARALSLVVDRELGQAAAFNKALARVYANPDLPMMCGVAVAEVDAERRFSPGQIEALSDHLVTFYGGLIRQAFPANDLAVRFDGLRFGFLFQTSDESEVTRLIDLLRAAFQTVALRDPRTGRNLGHLTLSAGVCMSESADSALDLAAACERALADAKGGGGDQVVVCGRGDEVPAGKEWMLYRA